MHPNLNFSAIQNINKENQINASNQSPNSFNKSSPSFHQLSYQTPQIPNNPCQTPISKQQRIPFLIAEVKKLKNILNQSLLSIEQIERQLKKLQAEKKDATYLPLPKHRETNLGEYKIEEHPIFNFFREDPSCKQWSERQTQKTANIQDKKESFARMMNDELTYYNRNEWKQSYDQDGLKSEKQQSGNKSNILFTYTSKPQREVKRPLVTERIHTNSSLRYENRQKVVQEKPFYTPVHQNAKFSFRKQSENKFFTIGRKDELQADVVVVKQSNWIKNVFLRQ